LWQLFCILHRFGRGAKNFIRFGRSALPYDIEHSGQGIPRLDTTVKPSASEPMANVRRKRAVPNLFALLNTAQSSSGWPEDDGFEFGSHSEEENPEEAILELQKRGFNRNFLR